MNVADIDYLAVLLAAIASFAFGSVYYMALAKPWMAALGKTEEEIKGEGMSPTPFVIAILAQLVMAFVLAGVIAHLGEGQTTIRNGMISGAFCWLGFVVTTMAVNHGFQGARLSLTFIDSGHWLGVLLIQGLVIGLMG